MRLSQCRKILSRGIRLFKKKRHRLSLEDQKNFEALLEALDNHLVFKNKDGAKGSAKELKEFLDLHFPKGFFTRFGEFWFGLLVALCIAFLIRQMWFELYEVPTGSMRPTIFEKERMLVSKTTFGIPIPFTNKLALFDPKYVLRNGIIVLTVRGMEMKDADIRYFYLFPGKKQFIKRCCAKGGDTIYFYGGRIYGIDQSGKPFQEMADEAQLKKLGLSTIEHIPFITFDGKIEASQMGSVGVFQKSLFKQMNLPIAQLEITSSSSADGRFFYQGQWLQEDLYDLTSFHNKPVAYSELWGMGNYAAARLLTKEDVLKIYKRVPDDKKNIYLELHHTPNLTYPKPSYTFTETGAKAPSLSTMTTLLGLDLSHLQKIHQALFTSRFEIKNHRAYLYSGMGKIPYTQTAFEPLFSSVEDGVYEVTSGVAYKIGFGGLRKKLPRSHPLNANTIENTKKLFNLGVAMNMLFQPRTENQPFLPARFAYYREGDLYLLGHPIIEKEEIVLRDFIEKELERQRSSTRFAPYVAFIDHGPPVTQEGHLDIQKIKAFGLTIPDNHLLALGDNYSLSADSREFGFVPYQNLRGSPKFIFWPFGSKLGSLPQATGPWNTTPNVIIQTVGFGIVILSLLITYQRRKQKRFKK